MILLLTLCLRVCTLHTCLRRLLRTSTRLRVQCLHVHHRHLTRSPRALLAISEQVLAILLVSRECSRVRTLLLLSQGARSQRNLLLINSHNFAYCWEEYSTFQDLKSGRKEGRKAWGGGAARGGLEGQRGIWSWLPDASLGAVCRPREQSLPFFRFELIARETAPSLQRKVP